MSDLILFDAMQEGLWVAVLISTPVLGAALAVGLAIGLLQALTSVQEMTLTFVPKMCAMLAVFWACMSFMTVTLTGFFENTVLGLIARGY